MSPALVQEVEDDAGPPTTLELTPVEDTLRRLLLDVANYIDESRPSSDATSQVILQDDLAKQPIILRFTGGWVRDKLLDVPSHDIDVAINKMTGYQFGLRMKEYLEVSGNPEKYGLEGVATSDTQNLKAGTTDKSKTIGGLHKIEANPEKSKHLETVTTRILGLDIDLVNLRKETYTEDSRNPQMEFGTPEEDAMRRDATVNAMFYNINTGEIEDFTGRGHDDMRGKIIRTPLEPYQTFKDDPLRVLRLIRFSSRLNYRIDQKALKAMRNADIQDALRRKISRERIGVEMEKALRGPDPHEALRLVFDLDLYETIFSDPTVETAQHHRPDTEGWQVMIDTLEDTVESEQTLAELLIRDDEEHFMSWQLAALIPYRDAPQPEAPAPGRKAPPPIAAQVAKEGIKATNKVTDIVIAAVRNQQEISSMVDALRDRQRRPDKPVVGDDASARDVLGMAIRRWGPSWRSQAMYAFLVEVVENQGSVEATERKFTAFLQHLSLLSLLDAYALKPLLDGKMLAKALNTPPGIWMKDALDVVMAWQLRHPGITDPQAAIEEVKQQKQTQGELAHALVRHFLKLTIRPLFAKTKPSTITAQGRKDTREVVLSPRMTMESEDEAVTKPWKSGKDGAAALDLLRWVVGAMDEKLVEEVWHLIVPPILTLLDDWETKYKQTGAELLNLLLQTTPSSLLERTGLGEVFEEALMLCLSHLPSLTPEPDSIALLSAVYPTLLTLAKTRYPAPPPPPTGPYLHPPKEADAPSHHRANLLNRILRKGIIQSHSLLPTHQHPAIIVLLLQQLVPLLNELGIQSVRHLQYLLPILTATLTDPHGEAAARVPVLRAGMQALRAVALNAWPRITEWRGEVLRGLTLCWLRTEGVEDGEEVEGLREEMREVVELMRVVVGEQVGFEGECAVLVAADGRLGGLLEVR
ncbi:CCA tRNA nucleotidyltransferase, mitochondrial [Friedmanniomyces endolithicus]|nr:CCA tRNA nucleotidyltransferase, mitochondrial [Friedmanniomyces endolithicus]